MRARYAKAKLGFGNALAILILTGILLVSVILFVMLFIKPHDYPERMLNCLTVEEVKGIEGYEYIKNAVTYLARDRHIDDVVSIKYTGYTYGEGGHYIVCIQYYDESRLRTNYIEVHGGKRCIDLFWGWYVPYYEAEFSKLGEYEEYRDDWINADNKDVAYARVEKELNEFAVQTVWDEVRINVQEGETN